MDKKLFYASIKERYQLNHPASSKKTYHIVLEFQEDGIHYNVGDCVAIYPRNVPEVVQDILSLLNFSGNECVYDRDHFPHLLKDFLLSKANLHKVTSSLFQFTIDPFPETVKFFDCNVLNFIKQHPISLSAQEFADALLPLVPRFYSIASSMKVVGEEVHLTIGLTAFESQGQMQFGTCSYFLTHIAPLHEPIIPLYFQQGRDFTLPSGIEDKNIIMIGPGTGIAPFIGFLQERIHCNHPGRNWLFFGERHKNYDYYYKNILETHIQRDKLKIDLAFSRDQEDKVYVQHKMHEKADEFVAWLDEGAYLYVCGDASRMAKDVEKTLQGMISSKKKISLEESKNYIKALRREKRYLRDIY